jgi:hypothetical protein
MAPAEQARRRATRVGRQNERSMQARRRRWRLMVAGAIVAIALIAVARMLTGASRTSPITVVCGPAGDQLHQFSGNQHAPFIALTDYLPIYDRQDQNYVLVDVRAAAERQQSHVPGDIWMPLADANSTGWQALLSYKDKTLVLY